jgi:hypothetical protein
MDEAVRARMLADTLMGMAPPPPADMRRKSLYPGEDAYFKANPGVTGMAAEDDKVILNPYSSISPAEQDAVARNEHVRLHLRRSGLTPPAPTDMQMRQFQGTPYASDPAALSQSIIARILSGDPSAGIVTPEQRTFANEVVRQMTGRP